MRYIKFAGRFIALFLSLLFFAAPKRGRVRVVVERSDGCVLLVKNYFSRQTWTLPGGGVERGETCAESASREVLEEVGLEIDDLRCLGTISLRESYLPFNVCLFTAKAKNDNVYRNFEIIEARWGDQRELPEEVCKLLKNKESDIN